MRALLGLLLTAGLAAAGPNLLVNPGAEEPTGWAGDVQRLTAPGTARSGAACLAGTVTAAEQHRRATQAVRLETGIVYDATFWARSDHRCQAVLWLQLGDERVNVGRWENLAPEWTRCATRFTVERSGDWEIQFILPSSVGGRPAGTVWADDFELVAQTAGRSVVVTATGEQADHATAATRPDGVVFAAWETFQPDRDVLVIARLAPGPPPVVERRWTVDFGADTFTLWPRMVAGSAGCWLLAAVERGRRWDVVAVPIADDGPAEPVWITADAATDVHIAGCVDETGLHLAWESNRDGPRRIWSASLAGRRPGEAVCVSGDGAYNPSVAASPGRVHVVYDRFLGANRDLCLATREGAAWRPERRLTRGNRYDVNPAAAWWRGGLWVAWELGWHDAYRLSSTDHETVMLARVGDDGLEVPVGWQAGVPGERIEQPGLCIDGAGRLRLAWQQARGADGRGGWELWCRAFGGAEWGEPELLSVQPGRAREPAVTASGDGVLALVQADNVAGGWASHEQADRHWTRMEAVAPAAAGPPPAEPRLAAYAGADEPRFAAAAERARLGEERAPFEFEHRGRRYTARWGNLHEHSDISVCNRAGDNRTEEDYVCMREIARFDFGAVTDHCYNQSRQIWRYSSKITRAQHDPKRFVTLVAEEWTSNNEKETKPPGYYGHRNLIFADPYEPTWLNSRDPSFFTPQQVWDTLAGRNFVMIPHQLADAGSNVPTDWNYVHEVYQPVAEIFQARESYEADDAPRRTKAGHPGYFLQDVWKRGTKIGVIAAPDHGGGKGKAGLLIDELGREPILDACRARATWGTSAAKIALAMTVADRLMGEAGPHPAGRPVRARVKVSAAGPIAAVRIIRNNQVVYTHEAAGPDLEFEYLDNAPLAQTSYYYARVEQVDGELAWCSPVWLERG